MAARLMTGASLIQEAFSTMPKRVLSVRLPALPEPGPGEDREALQDDEIDARFARLSESWAASGRT